MEKLELLENRWRRLFKQTHSNHVRQLRIFYHNHLTKKTNKFQENKIIFSIDWDKNELQKKTQSAIKFKLGI